MVAKQKSHYSKKCCNCPRSPLFNQSLCMTGIDSFIITHGNWAEKNIPPCAVFNWLQMTCCRSWLLYVRHVLIPFTKHSEFKIGRNRTWSEMASTVSNGNDRLRDGKLQRRPWLLGLTLADICPDVHLQVSGAHVQLCGKPRPVVVDTPPHSKTWDRIRS